MHQIVSLEIPKVIFTQFSNISSADGLSHLATLESLVVKSDEDRAFFNELIESSGQKSVLDDFFASADDDFDWDAVG